MPKIISSLAYFFAALAAAARVLVGCGLSVAARYTSHSTSTLLPPRMGSGQVKTGFNMQSLDSPVAWLVDEPSKPQIGGSLPSARTLVLERSSGVGSVPSIQMYSAW